MSGRGIPPTGDVALVFTDIEGSTKLLHELGDDFLSVLGEHNARVRATMTSRGGTEIKNEGDGFLFAFADPKSALIACAETQVVLQDGGWPHDRAVRVRMGAHLGPVTVFERDYVGLTVHETHRICTAATGGQVVATEAVVHAAGDLPPSCTITPLGSYRLRDFPEPRRLHQLTIEGLPDEFPTLRALAAQRTVAVPETSTALVGRAREVVELDRLLRGRDRLVTLTGPGGVGKTRLAIEAARRAEDHFDGGIWFVDLASVTASDAVVAAILREIGIDDGDPTRLPPLLAGRRALVVADNLEQIEGAAVPLTELIDLCGTLGVLATSRSRVRARGEHEVPVHGLDLHGAVELFMDVAPLAPHTIRATDPGVIEDICRQVDGMPLAIELMAPALAARTPRELLDDLRSSLDVMQGDDGSSMRATIAWSWDLLDTDERIALEAMSVTGGSVTTAHLATLVAAAGSRRDATAVVTSLAEKSLVLQERKRWTTRARVLEVIRRFAADELARDQALRAALEAAHASWCATLVSEAAPHLMTVDAAMWLDELDAERDNIRVGLEGAHNEPLLAEATHIAEWWTTRGHWTEGRRVMEAVLDRGIDDPELRANLLAIHASLALRTGAIDDACRSADEAFELADSYDVAPAIRSRTMNVLGEIARTKGEHDVAEIRYTEALACAPDDTTISVALSNLGVLAWQHNRLADARRWWSDAFERVAPLCDRRAVAIIGGDM